MKGIKIRKEFSEEELKIIILFIFKTPVFRLEM